jgi:glycosyltransferase involved in cell wall biosynthesis
LTPELPTSKPVNIIFANKPQYLKSITFTVINDLSYDQRMQRICSSLAGAGYKVTLVGRKLSTSIDLKLQPYNQKRLHCRCEKGKLMYLEFNFRLFIHLLFNTADCICAIDLDTILPCYFASKLRNKKRTYDAHELFTEQKEIVTRPLIQKLWLKVEKYAVPKFTFGYTVNDFIAKELNRRYGVSYAVVRNLPKFSNISPAPNKANPFIIYQGAVNEGRSFETLIPAMQYVNARLVICGNGNFFEQVQALIKKNKLEDKVELRGYVPPEELRQLTPMASIAVMLFENTGLNQYYSLANRFFDYIMAGVPQICVAYPEYKSINQKYGVAYLIYNTNTDTIATAINNLLVNNVLYNNIQQNCIKAREELNWSTEEKVLIEVYKNIFS